MPKQKVTLSLDTEIYERTKQALKGLAGKPSVSSLVDQLLDEFTRTTAPALAALSGGASPADAYSQLLEGSFAELVRILEEEEEEPSKPKK